MYVGLAALVAPMLWGCSDSDDDPIVASTAKGVYVVDTAGEPVAGAKLYAIPATDVELLAAVAIDRVDATTNFGNYSTTALTVDEPLEDIINGNFTGGVFDPAADFVEVDENGYYKVTDADVDDPDAKYFIYVGLAADDTTHLPGGSICREPVTLASLVGEVTEIEVSTKPSATATFVGTSSCLECHDDKSDMLKTAHKLGFMNTGAPSGLQDDSEFAADRTDEFNMYAALDKYEDGVTIYYYDYDSGRSFDKFMTSETDPADAGGVVYATVTLSVEGGKYYATFTNIVNPDDPLSGVLKKEVVLTYGGGVYKQRPITVVDDSLFMVPFQFNARGDETSDDRTRMQWRDYHMDWWVASINDTVDEETMTFKDTPPFAKAVDVQCAPCHFNGYSVEQIGDYYQATGVADVNGENHPVLNVKQELNIGCETCHGPGSEHVAAEGAGVAIVTPQNLAPERESIICGQCHARAQGNGTIGGDATLDANDKMMVAGTSRAAYLAANTSRHDSASGNMWADGVHSKAHHQQYTDFIQSAKYRNGTELLTCSSCHDLHAPGSGRHQLSGATDGSLCASCHETQGDDIKAHQEAKSGFDMGATCIQCHNTKTAGSGAGSNQTADEGFVVGENLYLHGDITSHVFDVPNKADAVEKMMPVPYTAPKLDNSVKCGGCHTNTSTL
jgi:predicted heme/steroid binding protein